MSFVQDAHKRRCPWTALCRECGIRRSGDIELHVVFTNPNVVTTVYMDYAEIMRILLLFATLFFLTSVSADVYRSIDEDGNVVFTDKPSPDAEKIRIDKVQTISPPAVKDFEYTPPAKSADSVYTKLEVVNPKNDQVFTGGTGDIMVSVLIQPALNTAHGDRLIIYMDGKKQAESGSTSFAFTGLHRGTHTTKVDVVNRDGKSIKSSAPVSFTIHRPSVQNPSRQPPPTPTPPPSPPPSP